MANTEVQTTESDAGKISRVVVQAFARFTGRGPVKARTTISENSIHVVLYDVLTTGEHNLVQAGHGESVLASRRAIQHGVSQTLIAGVEQVTGRTVTAFLSANNISPDVSVESFVLEPVA